ncbi:MAG: CDP-alcohol phosphatidyltransferase family protein [Chloroflexota bacterium]
MFDERLRDTKEVLFINLALGLRLNRIHPLWLTAVAFLFGLLAALFLWQQAYLWGLLFWWLNRIFDGLDGTVARVESLQTDLGGYLDILSDFVIYALVPISLVLANPTTPAFIALAFLLSAFYVNGASWMYLAAILEKRRWLQPGQKTSVNMPAGLIGGGETIVFYSAFMILPDYLVILFAIMSLLVAATIIQRIIWAARRLRL